MFGSKKSSEGAKPNETKEEKAARKLAEKEQKKREVEGRPILFVLVIESVVSPPILLSNYRPSLNQVL